ncbi:uncharacterized lipoprotein YehR (DUF1307 family) [Paenibacillus sp. V4I3]|nr:uncharacterized lipoprotein YehR (DUF1307 family) [Paenibacillus sp. V4I3]
MKLFSKMESLSLVTVLTVSLAACGSTKTESQYLQCRNWASLSYVRIC